ncbi:hypothetical protein BACCELL_00355 [Bacteroides cellulosilyticus DSM 14838]|uniref:Uncharacterized protein n=1 Tax=Bacteroides cellulosilyticus DSM 14838 TaxID=537012 RepID=E2N7W1_9BACE|nr:hypothetical protein BACCELL_00355 [Bacteroides cellulosilyticus DSM 14838]
MTQPIRLKIRGKSYLYCHNIKRINLFVISFDMGGLILRTL